MGPGPGPELDNYIRNCLEIGQPFDQEISDVTVDNLTAENTGDDSLALFNVVKNARISDCSIKYRFPFHLEHKLSLNELYCDFAATFNNLAATAATYLP